MLTLALAFVLVLLSTAPVQAATGPGGTHSADCAAPGGPTPEYNDTYVPTDEGIIRDVVAAGGGSTSDETADYNDTYAPTEMGIRWDVAKALACPDSEVTV
jgi:hypothetical protein